MESLYHGYGITHRPLIPPVFAGDGHTFLGVERDDLGGYPPTYRHHQLRNYDTFTRQHFISSHAHDPSLSLPAQTGYAISQQPHQSTYYSSQLPQHYQMEDPRFAHLQSQQLAYHSQPYSGGGTVDFISQQAEQQRQQSTYYSSQLLQHQYHRFHHLQPQQPAYHPQAYSAGGAVQVSPSAESYSSISPLVDYPGQTAINGDGGWKLQSRVTMQEVLQSTVVDMKESRAAEMREVPGTLEAYLRLEASYEQAMQFMTSVVKEQYQLELDRERNQRHWNAGILMWAKKFREEQQNIMNSMKQSGHQNNDSARFARGDPATERRSAVSNPEEHEQSFISQGIFQSSNMRNTLSPSYVADEHPGSFNRGHHASVHQRPALPDNRVAIDTVEDPKELLQLPPPMAPFSSINRAPYPSPVSPDRWDSSIHRSIPSVDCHLAQSSPRPPSEIWRPPVSPDEDALLANENSHEKTEETTRHAKTLISMDKPGEKEKHPHLCRNSRSSHVDPCLRSDDPLGSGSRSTDSSAVQREMPQPRKGLIPEGAEEAQRKEDDVRGKATENETREKTAHLEDAERVTRKSRSRAQKGRSALERQEGLRKMEEARRKDIEMRQREDILRCREEELLRREADYFRREREAKKEAMQENNTLLTGGTYNFAEGDILIDRSGKSIVDKGIIKLFLNIAPGAFHDSGERFDPPRCHPNTRVTVIQEIFDWLDHPESPALIMWLHGAAGAGKSAIAQTIADALCVQGRLGGSFFFARGSATGRGDEERLVPTLAYQLAKYLPETRAHITTAVLCDPAIFELTLLSQVRSLLIDPLRTASNAMSSSSPTDSPRLFIIDGLDECLYADVQCRVLEVFIAAVKGMQHHLPHKFLITSRCETHLLTGFDEYDIAGVCRRLPLDSFFP